MKAAVLLENEKIEYQTVADPKLVKGSVKVAVKYAGICGSDIPRVLKNGAHYYPIILGHEFSGEVVDVDNNVKDIKIGDHVVVAPLLPCMECSDCQNGNYSLCKNYKFIGSSSQGAFAQYVVVPRKNVVVIDKKIKLEKAALFEPATVALHGIFQCKMNKKGRTCVIGAGTIGLLTLSWLKALGYKVDMYGRGDKGISISKRMNADNVLCTNDENILCTANKITGGKGYDYIFDCVGSEKTIHLALEIAANKSTICMIGTPTDTISFSKKIWEKINRKELFLTGSWMSYSSPFPGKEWQMTNEYMSNNKINIDDEIINSIYPIDKANEVFQQYKKNNKISGRIILKHYE